MKNISYLEVKHPEGVMQVNFSLNTTQTARRKDAARYRSFYGNLKDSKGNKSHFVKVHYFKNPA